MIGNFQWIYLLLDMMIDTFVDKFNPELEWNEMSLTILLLLILNLLNDQRFEHISNL